LNLVFRLRDDFVHDDNDTWFLNTYNGHLFRGIDGIPDVDSYKQISYMDVVNSVRRT
jgi:hypothetical protein